MSKRFIFLVLLLLGSLHASVGYAAAKLVFAIDIIRHGDRTPVAEFAPYAYAWQEGLGELTALGMQQEYQLGHKLRESYVYQYHLLPACRTTRCTLPEFTAAIAKKILIN